MQRSPITILQQINIVMRSAGIDNIVRLAKDDTILYDTRITNDSVSYGCPTVAEGDDVDALQAFLDGSANVTQDGSIPPASPLPDNGFFEQTDVVGSDVDSWKGNWAFGL